MKKPDALQVQLNTNKCHGNEGMFESVKQL